MKKYLLLLTVLAVLAGCKKHEVVETPGIEGTSMKTYSMTVDLIAGQNINVGTVTFYDPTDGNGGPLEVTYTLTGGWTMTESHVYAGPINEMPVNKPGAPKIGKFPYQETHPNVTNYTYYIPLGEVDMGNFGIAAHCVVSGNGTETGWAAGDSTFNDKGWGTYIPNFYAPTNFIPNNLYAIQRTTDGTFNLVLINANNGDDELIYSENITGSNGTIGGAGYDPATGYLFFTLGNGLYGNNLRSDDPTFLITTVNSSSISGTTFNNSSYYYYDNNLQQIVEVQMSYDIATGWSYVGEQSSNTVMDITNFTITDITSYNNTIYLIGFNSLNSENPVSLLDYDISTSTFGETLLPVIGMSSMIDSPTIAASPDPSDSGSFILYALNEENGVNQLVSIDLETGITSIPQADDDDDDVILGR